MFFKLLDNQNNLILVTDKALFFRYAKTAKKLISCKSDIAEVVVVNNTYYNLQGRSAPEESSYIICEISEEKYNELYSKMQDIPNVISPYLRKIREDKIQELCSECMEKITSGCDICLSDRIKHFKFTEEDQLNINRIMTNIQLYNLSKVLYHATGDKIEYYSRADFTKIYTEMNKHITYHTTYFNLLKNCIYNMYIPKDILAITYGYILPDKGDRDLLKEIRR